MMGYSHTVSAAAGWLVLVETGVVQVPDTPTLIVTTLACAGAGMLPDIDHHNGSIANSIPPISRWVARIVGAVSGGHRKGTHSILGLVAFWAIAYFSANLNYNGIPWASLLLAAFSGGLALRVLGAPGGWIGAVALGYAAYTTDSLALLPWAISVGATIHLIGDLLTTRGLLPLYPIVIKPLVASPPMEKERLHGTAYPGRCRQRTREGTRSSTDRVHRLVRGSHDGLYRIPSANVRTGYSRRITKFPLRTAKRPVTSLWKRRGAFLILIPTYRGERLSVLDGPEDVNLNVLFTGGGVLLELSVVHW